MILRSRESAKIEPPVLVGTEEVDDGVAVVLERGDEKVSVGRLTTDGKLLLSIADPESLKRFGFQVGEKGHIVVGASA